MSRYEIVELPKDDRGRKVWGIEDRKTGKLVLAKDEQGEFTEELLVFYTEDQAESWPRRQRYLNEVGHHG